MGQLANFGLVKKMRFYAGLQYASIESDEANYFYAPINFGGTLGSVRVEQYNNTEFKGVGPAVGIDYSYNLNDSWSLTANGAASILLGHSKYFNDYVAVPAGTAGAAVYSLYGSKNAIVPSLEAKLGVNYAYSFASGVLNVQGGYQALNYFNALQSQNLQNATVPIGNSDYGLYGPYFGVKYVGNA